MLKKKIPWLTLMALLLCVSLSWAQGGSSTSNSPAKPDHPTGTKGNETEPVPAGVSVAPPLSGAELFPLESPDSTHSFLLTSVRLAFLGDSRVRSVSEEPEFGTVGQVGGQVALQRSWGRYQLVADYSGGGVLYNRDSELNTSYHAASFRMTATWKRWELLLRDSLSYLPESSFGSEGGGARVGSPFSSLLANLNPLFLPSQTILTVHVPRLSNTFVGQANYAVTPRSTLTVAGSFATLNFRKSDAVVTSTPFLDSRTASLRVSYDYALGSADTIGVIYDLDFLRFSNTDLGSDTHVVHFGYARRLTGRLSAEFSIGPQVVLPHGVTGGSDTRTGWSMLSSLVYHTPNGEMGLFYLKGLTGGSGVLPGAQTHQVSGNMQRLFGRVWSASVRVGYARNQNLFSSQTSCVGCAFDTYNANFGVERRLGRQMWLKFSTGVDEQRSGVPFCTGVSCGTSLFRYRFGVEFEWDSNPIVIR